MSNPQNPILARPLGIAVAAGLVAAGLAAAPTGAAECLETLLDRLAPFDVDEVVLACLSPGSEHQLALIPLIQALAGSS